MNEILVVKIPVKKKGESVHMKKVVAMYEQEEAYGKNLAEYVNRKENMPFEVQVFSQADKLSDYLQGHTPQLLLLSEESSLESYGDMCKKTQDVLYLTEHKDQARDQKGNHIYKYQPTDQLLNQLMQHMSDHEKKDSPVMQESCPIYGVYSPVGRCGKTTFSLLLGELLARKRSVLYIGFDELPFWDEEENISEEQGEKGTLSDDRELLNEFDLMLLNENELSNNQDIEEVVSKYLTMNANPKQDHLLLSGNLYRGTSSTAEIENTVSVIENEGELFARSVLEFMKYRTLGIAVEKVQEQLEELEMGDDAKTMAKEQQELEQESFDEQFLEKTNDEKKKYEEAIEESWLEKLEKLKEDGWLNFVLPFDQAASGYVIEAEDLPSKWRTVNFTWYHSAISEMEESFLFTEYLLEHCRSFTSTGETNKMAYELEYILNGKTSDKENIKSTVNSLLLMREGLNLFSAWKDPVLSSQAETAAATLVGWTGVYPAIKLTQGVI